MDFSVETWACIDVIKICPHIDLELKYAQAMFRQRRGNVKSSTFVQRQEYIRLLKKFDLLSNETKNEINFFDIISQAIKNEYVILSEQLLHRHVLRERIHENNNKILIEVIQEENTALSQYLLSLPKVKSVLVEQNNVLIAAVLKNNVEIFDLLLDTPGVKETVHHHDNVILYHAMYHSDLAIFRKLIILPEVKKNIAQVMPRICEFLNPAVLKKTKEDMGLKRFDTHEIIHYAFEVSRAGHVLGLSNVYLPSDLVFPMNFSGSSKAKSLNWILNNFAIFLKKEPASKLKKNINIIFSIFKTCDYFRKKMFDFYANEKIDHTAHIDLFNLFLLNKMLYVLSGWKGHSIGVVLYKIDAHNVFIVVTNRGELGDENFGSKIYKVIKVKALTAEWIRKIQIVKTHEEFLLLLKLVIDVNKPLFSLLQKAQKHPTCGYANKISAIEPMLLLLRAKFSGELSKVGGLQRIFDQYKRYDYKRITSDFRDQAVNRIINMIELKRFHSELSYDLVRSIILQHPGNTDRNSRPKRFKIECQRAKKLLMALPEFYQKKFRKTHGKLYHLIDFGMVENSPQKCILMNYQRKRAPNRALSLDTSTSDQFKPYTSLKF